MLCCYIKKASDDGKFGKKARGVYERGKMDWRKGKEEGGRG